MHPKDFQFYKPCQALQPYVRYYWAFRSDQMLNTLTFPIGCPQIIFHKKAPLYVPELDTCQHKLTVSGQVNYPAHLCTRGDTEMIVVVFQPHAMKTFLDLPIFLLHNQEISGYDLGNKSCYTIRKFPAMTSGTKGSMNWLRKSLIAKTQAHASAS